MIIPGTADKSARPVPQLSPQKRQILEKVVDSKVEDGSKSKTMSSFLRSRNLAEKNNHDFVKSIIRLNLIHTTVSVA